VTALLLRPDPAALGLRPDGDPEPLTVEGPAPPARGQPYAQVVRSRLYRSITLAWMLALLAQVGGIAHLVPLVDGRVDAATAALAVSVLAASSMMGRLAGGWLFSRVALRPACLGWMALQAGGLAALALLDGRTALLASASLLGLSVGNVLLLQPVVLADVFGVRDYPRIFATSQLVSTVGVAGGPYLIGVLRDATDGYRAAYLVASGISLVAAAVILAGGPFRTAPTAARSEPRPER
jgi:predicted MFS family arabinose efflux permease